MKSLYRFIVKPLNERYDNVKTVDDKTLIINTGIENHRFVSKKAAVVSTPAAYTSKIKVGDRFYTPYEELEKSKKIRTIYNFKGLKETS